MSIMRDSLGYERYLPNDIFYTTKEILEEYGSSYEIFIADTLLIKSEEAFSRYDKENIIEKNTQNGAIKISKNLILDLITNDGMYNYLLAHMDNPLGTSAKVSLFQNGDSCKMISITRADLAELLKTIDITELDAKQQIRRSLVINLSTMYSLAQKYNDVDHVCTIDGEMVRIPSRELLSILTMDEDEFNRFTAGLIKTKYSKEYRAYALVDFIQRERILAKYVLSPVAFKRYRTLESYNLIDFEVLNHNQKTNDYDFDGSSLTDQVKINPEVEKYLLDNMEPTYSKLEKAIHIYIRMCEILTYDQSFYAVNQSGEARLVHEDITHLSNITLENNEVVCYEFVMMFAAMLKKLGINYTVDSSTLYGYGGGHSSLTFRESEFLVSADSVISVISNDMANAKLNIPLTGLRCLNANEVTSKKFDEIFYKVMLNNLKRKEQKQKFNDSLKEYRDKYEHVTLDTKEKLFIILKELARSDLKGMDSISYQKLVFDNVFKPKGNVSINFISSKVNRYKGFNYTPITIITILTIDGYRYFAIDPNSADIIMPITAETLIDMFESRKYAYIAMSDKQIPGLGLEKSRQYVR